ncbi:type II toxin-antitoxin system HicB family antitoxin [Cetobacterium sp. 2A]|uniref:type II toxin-antitoxin system HicB family antitoxin n=1 Tax=Cetobacterium sp. 2A TaxID=2754723 RepID=UPI00163BCFCD|nr:type II toxin-antitoxin system HicB family antitoxin [Cetobacterium sp. 2A]MBC2855484.1 type II toxin-antitoxin system HicB family antitoxin [Cetobacterium sp. 2A]
MNDIVYPVILTYINDVIYVEIPDFSTGECATYGNNINDTIQNSKELLTLLITEYEDSKKKLPKPSGTKDFRANLGNNQEVIYISLWLPYEKALTKTVYKKKTLNIPTWLDMLATEKNINFSQVLQKALKKELGIE